MGFLHGKRALITGIISQRSIAWGIAEAMHREGAQLAFTYVNDSLKNRVDEAANAFGSNIVLPCDVGFDDQIEGLFENLGKHWDGLDILVHSIGFSPREALQGEYLDNLTRENFKVAHDISAYSLSAMAKAARPLMKGRGGSVLTLTYLGAERAMANYNVMGVAKAALESSVRYLAAELGPQNIRVNAISAGAIKTLAAAGISGFSSILQVYRDKAPLRRGVDQSEVADTAVFLLGPGARAITGEIVMVDAGFHAVGI